MQHPTRVERVIRQTFDAAFVLVPTALVYAAVTFIVGGVAWAFLYDQPPPHPFFLFPFGFKITLPVLALYAVARLARQFKPSRYDVDPFFSPEPVNANEARRMSGRAAKTEPVRTLVEHAEHEIRKTAQAGGHARLAHFGHTPAAESARDELRRKGFEVSCCSINAMAPTNYELISW